MRVLDLFAGLGGFSLAAHSLGMETVAFCECEPYPVRVLERHFPGVPVFPDVTTITVSRTDGVMQIGDSVSEQRTILLGGGWNVADTTRERMEGLRPAGEQESGVPARPLLPGRDGSGSLILTAGFPCQDLSYAGKGAGLDGHRSRLFFEVARLADELRPDFLLLENVAALLTRGIDTVLGTLAALGYDALWSCIPACAVGAPHRRDRIWIVAAHEGTADLQAIYERVLRGLTPFGDLSDGWPTATASDAWAGEHNRSQTIPCNGRVLTGKAGLGLGQAARGDTWPTPNTSDGDRGPDYAKAAREGAGGDDLTTRTCREEKVSGSLNPAWVETLMGYPIGYTEPDGDPLTDLPGVWPGVTPAGMYPTPRSNADRDGRSSLKPEGHNHWSDLSLGQAAEVASGQLPRELDSHDELPPRWQTWPAGLGAPQHPWEPPRLTTDKTNRAARLKALGNSIVPAVARLWLSAIQQEASA